MPQPHRRLVDVGGLDRRRGGDGVVVDAGGIGEVLR
jgi:hypothetical protein